MDTAKAYMKPLLSTLEATWQRQDGAILAPSTRTKRYGDMRRT